MAKSRSIGGIYAELSLRDGKFKAGMKAASVAIGRFAKASAKYTAIGTGAAAAASTAALARGTLKTLDQVDALGDLSAQTGVAVADMMKLQRAYADGGRSADAAGKDIGKMQKTLFTAASGGKDPFASIGLSAAELLKLDPATQFERIGDAIMRIENPAERTAKSMEIFGKGGAGLTTIFPGLKDAERTLGRMPELAQQFSGAMGEANDLIGHLPVKSDQFFTGFTAGIIGELLPNLQKIDNYDFTNIGESLGSGLAIALQTITDGSAWDLFVLQGEKAFVTLQKSEAVNGWAASINAVFDGITSTWGDGYKFSEAFDKYAEAGQNANAEILADLEKRIRDSQDSIFQKFRERRSSAANAPAEAIVNPIRNVAATELALKEAAKPAFSDPLSFVNDYQRRGLSLDANGGAMNEEKSQTKLLGEVRDLLKRIEETRGGLLWGQ